MNTHRKRKLPAVARRVPGLRLLAGVLLPALMSLALLAGCTGDDSGGPTPAPVRLAAWQSTEDLGGTLGTDYDLLFARSTDGGATWSAPAALNTNADSDTGTDYFVTFASAGQGGWIAAWASNEDLGGTLGTDNDILFARSTDDGVTWSAPAALNTNADSDSGIDFIPTLASDGQGVWLATWYSGEDLGGTLGTDLDILFARSTDGGATWSAPAALNTNADSDTGSDGVPTLVSDGQGVWLATWYSGEDLGGTLGTDNDILFARSTDDGATWSAPAALNTNADGDTGSDIRANVGTDGAGVWIAAWYSAEDLGGTLGTDYDILFARSTDGGVTWSAPAPLNTNAAGDTGEDQLPALVSIGQGVWLTVWESSEDLGGPLGTDFDILFARSTDGGATWSAPAALNTNADSDTGEDSFPSLVSDGAGGWLAAWYSNEDLGGTLGTDDDILFARSTDGGATWSAPAALNTNADSDTGGDLGLRFAP